MRFNWEKAKSHAINMRKSEVNRLLTDQRKKYIFIKIKDGRQRMCRNEEEEEMVDVTITKTY